MPVVKGKSPAARGPLAKVAMSNSYESVYSEFVADTGEVVLKSRGDSAIESFEHPDFDKKKFSVHEHDYSAKGPERAWCTVVHVVRDGVVIRKSFSFKCLYALHCIKQLNQIGLAAYKPSSPKKALKERAGVL